MKKKEPHSFSAREDKFTVQLDYPCVLSGYSVGDKYACFRRPIPVKKGDTFQVVKGKVVLNGEIVQRAATPLKRRACKISWVANRLRVVVFQERDRLWSKKLGRFTKKMGDLYWVAYDVRSYHVGTGKTPVEAVKALILQCQATNIMADEEKAMGGKVIRWRCLLPPNEVKDAERKARKTGFILDGVVLPPYPQKWQLGLEKLRRKYKTGT
jgi:hypothetical protein